MTSHVRAAALLALTVGVAGCESSQSRSARLAHGNQGLGEEHAVKLVARANPAIDVLGTTVLRDANGTAAVVRLRNRSVRAQAALPLALEVLDAKGRSLYRNNLSGLEASLRSVALLRGGETSFWVDNQVVAGGVPRRARASVGLPADASPAAKIPRIALSGIRLGRDASGVFAGGTIENRSKIAQKGLTISCVARRGARIVAAGRAAVERLPPRPTPKPVTFTVFFIGDPRTAKLECSAPPTVLGGTTP